MSAYKPVGISTSVASATSSAKSVAISQQSEYVRVVALSNDAHVLIQSGEPVANTEDFLLVKNVPEVISIGKVRSQPIVGFTKANPTTITFQQGTGSQFAVGDFVTLTAPGQSAFDFEHKQVLSVNNTAGVGGDFSRVITVDYDSSSVSGTFDGDKLGSVLRASIKVAAIRNTANGTVTAQQVQITGG